MRRFALRSAVLVMTVVMAGRAQAVVQDEIQVYTDDINKKGEKGLELHINTTPQGRKTPDYPGEVVPNHGWRLNPEFSYGLTDKLEAGLYIPLMLDGDGRFYLVGTKVRLKWIPVQVGESGVGWYLGANQELSYVGKRFNESRWQTELKPIVGYKAKDWNFAFNPNLDWDLSDGLGSAEPNFAPAIKVMRQVAKGIELGAEYYSDMGKIGHILPWQKQDNRIYGVMDFDMKPFVFNVGVGRGLTEASDKWTLKAIFEIPIDAKKK